MGRVDLKQRQCLKCSKMFRSRGAFNRICPDCAKVNARLNVSEAQLQRERGVKRHNGEVIETASSETSPAEFVLPTSRQGISA